MPHLGDDCFGYLGQERLLCAQFSAEEAGSAQYPAQDIASSFIRGHNAIGDEKGDASTMFSYNPDRLVGSFVLAVFHPCQSTYLVSQGDKEVGIVDRRHALHHSGDSFQSHSCVDVWLR